MSCPEQKREGGSSTLIGKIWAAAGPDRELDEMIHCDILGNARSRAWCDHCHSSSVVFYPDYTASIGTALRLLPPGWHAILYTENNTAELYDATLKRRAGVKARARCASLAIAICATALEARSQIAAAVGDRPAAAQSQIQRDGETS